MLEVSVVRGRTWTRIRYGIIYRASPLVSSSRIMIVTTSGRDIIDTKERASVIPHACVEEFPLELAITFVARGHWH